MAELRVRRRPLPFRFLQQANREANKHFKELLVNSLARIEAAVRAMPSDAQEGTFIAMTKALAPTSGDQPLVDWRRRQQYGQGEQLTGCWTDEVAERYVDALDELEDGATYEVPYLKLKDTLATSSAEKEVLKKTSELVLTSPPVRTKLLQALTRKQQAPMITEEGLVVVGGEQVFFARLIGMQALLCRERRGSTSEGRMQRATDWLSEDFLRVRAMALSRARCRRYAIPSCLEQTAELARKYDVGTFVSLTQGEQEIMDLYHEALHKHSAEMFKLWAQLFKQFVAMGHSEDSAKAQIQSSPLWKSRSKQNDSELQKMDVEVSIRLRQQKEMERVVAASQDLAVQDDYQPSRSYADPRYLWKEAQVDHSGLFLRKSDEGIKGRRMVADFAVGEAVRVEDVTGAWAPAIVLAGDGELIRVRRGDGEIRVIRGAEGIRRK